MAIVKRPPHTVRLAGGEDDKPVNDYVASAAITPGMLIQMHDDGGVNKWRPNASATDQPSLCVALEQTHMNKGIDDAYAADDQVLAWFLHPGYVFYGIIPSGQNIANGDYMQSNGDGKLKEATATTAAANVARFQSLDNVGAVTVDTRVRVQVIC